MSLALGANKQHGATLGHGLLDELIGAVDESQRLLQVNDVDAIALSKNKALHLGVPATGLVPEVDAALEELASGNNGHAEYFLTQAGERARAIPGQFRLTSTTR